MVRKMKSRLTTVRLIALALALLIAAPGWAVAQGQIYVLESTVDTLKAGKAYDMGERISIPADGSIRAVMPSGKTQTIRGPYSGPVADLAKGQKANDGVVSWIKNLMQTGLSQERTPGATRSMRPIEAPPKFSWTEVPAALDGNFCIEKGAKLKLRRAASARAERMTVTDVATSKSGEVEFADDADTTEWPVAVMPTADAVYSVAGADKRARRVKLRVLDSLPSDEDLVAELAARQCKHQFDLWVKEKVAAGKRKAS